MHGGGIVRCKDSKETYLNGMGTAGGSYRDGGPGNNAASNSPQKRINTNLLENGKSSRKRSLANGALPEQILLQKSSEARQTAAINNKRGSIHETSMEKTGS